MGKTLGEIERSHIARYELCGKFIRKDSFVLDYGCGSGYGSFILAKKAKEVVGIDNSIEAVCHALKYFKMPNIDFRYSSYSYINQICYFDLVVCLEVIEHIQDADELMDALVLSAKSGGTLILSTPNGKNVPFSRNRFPFHVRHYTGNEFEKLARNHGLSVYAKFHQMSKINPNFIAQGFGGGTNIIICRKSKR